MTPLKGLKVVELARILAGPWIGQSLADLGAEVHLVGDAAEIGYIEGAVRSGNRVGRMI